MAIIPILSTFGKGGLRGILRRSAFHMKISPHPSLLKRGEKRNDPLD
jgi:hypothetical protein